MNPKTNKQTAKSKSPKQKEKDIVKPAEEDVEEENAEVDPNEQEIAKLLSKTPKTKKVEKHDIDQWLIDRELESAEKEDDWF